MAMFPSATIRNDSEDAEIWASLRDAIASSSGFQGWKQQQEERSLETQPLDKLVRLYLRETLETLAY
ncbi:MAG: hypothetical protein AAGE59_00590 [Cyanobacteria bacterium P01_F01_bin.86]